MRARPIILIVIGVLALNTLIILAVLGWFRFKGSGNARAAASSSHSTSSEGAGSPLPLPNLNGTWVEFQTPQEGEAVQRRFRVAGRCGSLPGGSRLLLVVDSGRDVYSPKLPPAVVDGESWSGSANEFGAPSGGTFSLCAFVVSDEAVERITEWHAQGKATGKWPPFRGSIPGGVEVARIKLRVAGK